MRPPQGRWKRRCCRRAPASPQVEGQSVGEHRPPAPMPHGRSASNTRHRDRVVPQLRRGLAPAPMSPAVVGWGRRTAFRSPAKAAPIAQPVGGDGRLDGDDQTPADHVCAVEGADPPPPPRAGEPAVLQQWDGSTGDPSERASSASTARFREEALRRAWSPASPRAPPAGPPRPSAAEQHVRRSWILPPPVGGSSRRVENPRRLVVVVGTEGSSSVFSVAPRRARREASAPGVGLRSPPRQHAMEQEIPDAPRARAARGRGMTDCTDGQSSPPRRQPACRFGCRRDRAGGGAGGGGSSTPPSARPDRSPPRRG
jgi:hypothetical protein